MAEAPGESEQARAAAAAALDRLIAACPSFLGATELFDYISWQEDVDRTDTYTRAGAFAHHLVDLLAAGAVDELTGTFAVMEELVEEGGEESELVRMGIVEPLQNICSHDDVAVDASRFAVVLGPQTAAIWAEIDELWRDAGTRPAPVARPTEAEYLGVDDPNVARYLRIHRRQLDDGTLASASDVLRLETYIADVTYTSRRAFRRAALSSLFFGLVLAVAVFVLFVR